MEIYPLFKDKHILLITCSPSLDTRNMLSRGMSAPFKVSISECPFIGRPFLKKFIVKLWQYIIQRSGRIITLTSIMRVCFMSIETNGNFQYISVEHFQWYDTLRTLTRWLICHRCRLRHVCSMLYLDRNHVDIYVSYVILYFDQYGIDFNFMFKSLN